MSNFNLGIVTLTTGVYDSMNENADFKRFVQNSFNRYRTCDWGDMCEEDKTVNDEAVKTGDTRILASYNDSKTEKKILIITEWDRSVTTVLFPSEC